MKHVEDALSRRGFLGALASGATAVAANAATSSTKPTTAKHRPNVVLIMTDDQGYGDLGCHGNKALKTPNLDRLAGQSVELRQFHVSPVCAPTRASLLTGRYNLRCGVWSVSNGPETMWSDEVTLAELLAAGGYRTGIFGKWHLGEYYPWVPNAQGFHEFVGFRTGHWENYFDTTLERNGKPVKTKGYITDVITSEAVKFIESNRDKPFFCYVPYNAPHNPTQVPDRYVKPYEAAGVKGETARYYGMIASLDENIGRLLAKLDELKLADNTIVIFLTDNGPNGSRYNCEMRGAKASVYEGGIRVPFFIRWPGKLAAGKKVDTIAAHIDVLPTLLEACGLAKPKDRRIDGLSLMPLLRGQAKGWPDRMLFFHWKRSMKPEPHIAGAVRTQQHKLVKGKELYDMQADPGEKKDVAAQNAKLVAKLRAAYEAWWKDVTAKRGFVLQPIPVGHPEENPVTLQGHHVNFHGQVKFASRGFAHDWITNWTRTEDFIDWDIDVVHGGRYEVSVNYRCPKADAGSKIKVSVGAASVDSTVPAAELAQGAWAKHRIGTLELKPGRTRLSIRALTKPGKIVLDLASVELKRL